MLYHKPNILIVGGAGYIGSHVNKLLNESGKYNTIVFDNLIYGHKEFVRWGDFILGDLSNVEQIRLCFRRYKIDAVMHFSAYAYVGESVKKPQEYYYNNVVNTLNLLKVMLENGVKFLVFSSSCATYGIPEKIPITEDQNLNPINPYGRTKSMIEHILKDYDRAYGIKFVSLRYFNAAGADPSGLIGEWHDPETHIIPLLLDVAIGRKESFTIYGNDYPTPDGTCIRDFIHVNDLAKAHMLAIDYLLNGGESEVFNLGTGKGYSVMEIVRIVSKITSRDIKVIIGERRAGDPPILISDFAKIKSKLGWYPEYSDIENIVRTAWDWHQILYSKFKVY